MRSPTSPNAGQAAISAPWLYIIARSALSAYCSSPQYAEFEREILRERVRAGLAHARENGKRLRPPGNGGAACRRDPETASSRHQQTRNRPTPSRGRAATPSRSEPGYILLRNRPTPIFLRRLAASSRAFAPRQRRNTKRGPAIGYSEIGELPRLFTSLDQRAT
jgi:hypothetical protein